MYPFTCTIILAKESSSLKVSQSSNISCLVISDFGCNANCLSFVLKFTIISITKLFSASDLN